MEGLQSMLVAQMLSIHQLQQKSMTYAHAIGDFRLQKHYTNSAVKLSNCFGVNLILINMYRLVGNLTKS